MRRKIWYLCVPYVPTLHNPKSYSSDPQCLLQALLKHAHPSSRGNNSKIPPPVHPCCSYVDPQASLPCSIHSCPPGGSSFNENSPSGIAVNALLLAAHAMTELGEKRKEKGSGTAAASMISDELKDLEHVVKKVFSPSAALVVDDNKHFELVSTPMKTVVNKKTEVGLDCKTPAVSTDSCFSFGMVQELKYCTQRRLVEVSPDIIENTSARKRRLEIATPGTASRGQQSEGIKLSVYRGGTKLTVNGEEIYRERKNTPVGDYFPLEHYVSADNEDVLNLDKMARLF
mmetsp:Transcript_36372/g.59312  ORF Transcript_36372/g.59312 Transcript_36372/m.59312 type:complete len:286 (-) Transcript_36372:184-1041(-)